MALADTAEILRSSVCDSKKKRQSVGQEQFLVIRSVSVSKPSMFGALDEQKALPRRTEKEGLQ
jgi:hypothetical protein